MKKRFRKILFNSTYSFKFDYHGEKGFEYVDMMTMGEPVNKIGKSQTFRHPQVSV